MIDGSRSLSHTLPIWSPGVRLLRQDPVECLFSFICSSNNNITRISGMVERLCQAFGPRLVQLDDITYYGFPSLQALAGKQVCPLLHGLSVSSHLYPCWCLPSWRVPPS